MKNFYAPLIACAIIAGLFSCDRKDYQAEQQNDLISVPSATIMPVDPASSRDTTQQRITLCGGNRCGDIKAHIPQCSGCEDPFFKQNFLFALENNVLKVYIVQEKGLAAIQVIQADKAVYTIINQTPQKKIYLTAKPY